MEKMVGLLFLALFSVVAGMPEHLFPVPEAEPTSGKHWGVLVAGSNGWYNYRHQADICHAYQLLHENGIPDERIIVFMYDDIAKNEENPFPGKIFNKPNGPDVYPGVLKNYTGKDVTPENFVAVLTGNSSAVKLKEKTSTGGVLKSGPNDNVFVYFADHGAPDLIAFPYSELSADDLLAALHKMFHQQQYNKLVFFLEACESGSMFENLPKNMNIYATTAAGPDESSWGTYCDDPKIDTCLGDEYSVRWMEDADTDDLSTETLAAEFKLVKSEVVKSTPHKYGDMSFSKTDTMIKYLGKNKQGTMNILPVTNIRSGSQSSSSIPSPEMSMAMLQKKLMKTSNNPAQRDLILQKIINEAQTQRTMIRTVETIARLVSGDSLAMTRPDVLKISNKSCYKTAVQKFSDRCFTLGQHEYALRLVYVFANLCDGGAATSDIVQAIGQACF